MLPPAGQELPLGWVLVEDTPTVPGVTWKTLTVQPPSGQGPIAQGEPLRAPAAPWCCPGARDPWEWGVGRVLGAQGSG